MINMKIRIGRIAVRIVQINFIKSAMPVPGVSVPAAAIAAPISTATRKRILG